MCCKICENIESIIITRHSKVVRHCVISTSLNIWTHETQVYKLWLLFIGNTNIIIYIIGKTKDKDSELLRPTYMYLLETDRNTIS